MRSVSLAVAAMALLGACAPVYGPTAEGRHCRSLTSESERDLCFGKLEAQGYTQLRDQLGGRASEGQAMGADSGAGSGSSGGSSGSGGGGGSGGGAGAGGGGGGGAGGGGGGGSGGGGAGGGGGGGGLGGLL